MSGMSTSSGATGSTGNDTLARLAQVIESRRGGDPARSYVARLFSKGQSEKSIARDMGLANHQLVQNILRRVKRDTPSIYWRAVDRHMAARGIIR